MHFAGDLPDRAAFTVTDAFGRVRAISGRTVRLEPGTYSFEFRAPGHDPDKTTFTLQAGENRRWAPSIRAVATPAQPSPPAQSAARDARADEAAIEVEIKTFVAAFSSRAVNRVQALLLREDRDVWLQMLSSRDVTNFRALLLHTEPPRIEGQTATVQFVMGLSYRNLNETLEPRLNWIGSLDRIATGWRLSLVRQVRN